MYLWMLAAVVAYFIKGLCGFANTLVFTAILSFGSVNANISPIDLLLGYPDLSFDHMLGVIRKLDEIKNEPGKREPLWLMQN